MDFSCPIFFWRAFLPTFHSLIFVRSLAFKQLVSAVKDVFRALMENFTCPLCQSLSLVCARAPPLPTSPTYSEKSPMYISNRAPMYPACMSHALPPFFLRASRSVFNGRRANDGLRLDRHYCVYAYWVWLRGLVGGGGHQGVWGGWSWCVSFRPSLFAVMCTWDIHTSACVYIYICICICIYMYIYIRVCIYIYI